MRPMLLFLSAMLLSVSASAQDGVSLIIPRLDAAPEIDGQLGDAAWTKAAVLKGFTLPGKDAAALKNVEARIGFLGADLFVAVRCTEPDLDKVKARAKNRNDQIWTDDCVEVWIRPTSDALDTDQFLVNSIGTQGELRKRGGAEKEWHPAWTVKTAKEQGAWTVEMKISAADLGWKDFHRGDMIDLKIGREDYVSQPTTWAVWPPQAPYSGFDGLEHAYFESDNAVVNPAYEAPQGWETDPKLAGKVQSVAEGEARVLKLQSPGEYAALAQTLRLLPDTTYRLSTEVRASGSMLLRVRAPQADKKIDERMDLSVEKNDTYKPCYKRFTTGPSGQALLVLSFSEQSGTGEFTFRNLKVTRELTSKENGAAIPVKGGVAWAKKLAVTDCRDMRGFVGAPVDGSLKSGQWDGGYWEYNQPGCGAGVGYAYMNSDGLHITFDGEQSFNWCVVRGGIKAGLYHDVKQYDDPKSGTPVYEFPGLTQNSRAWIPTGVKAKSVSFFNVTDGVIGDCAFFNVKFEARKAGADDVTLALTKDSVNPEGALKAGLDGRFAGNDRTFFALKAGAAEESKVNLEGERFVHFLSEPFDQERALTSVTLESMLDGSEGPLALTVRVQDPLNPRHELCGADFDLDKGKGAISLSLEFVPQVVSKGTRLWISLATERPAMLKGAKLVLHTAPIEQVRDQARAYRLFLLKGFYSIMSEARPWNGWNRQEDVTNSLTKDSPYRQWLQEIVETLDQCRALDPEGKDQIVRQYYEWIYRQVLRKSGKLTPWQTKFDQIEGVPEWAALVHQAWMQTREIPKWWIEHRMVATGELGGEVNDDTDMFGNWEGFPMFERDGAGGMTLDCGERLAQCAEENNMTEGVNRFTMDALHAYEEGLNLESQMLWWFYGDPVYTERCMAAARSLEKITFHTPKGFRRFPSIGEIGVADLKQPRKPVSDGEFNHLMMHPALMYAWYNRSPRTMKMLREWADGWLDHYAQAPAGKYPKIIDSATEKVTQYEDSPFPGCWGGEGSAYVFMADLSGEEKYIKPYLDFMSAKESNQPGSCLYELYQLGFLKGKEDKFAAVLGNNWTTALYTKNDTGPFITAIKKDIEELQRWPYIYTAVECFTDRVFLYPLINPSIAYTGGYGTRNKINANPAVTWEGFGTDYAALVTRADAKTLRVLLCNISDKPIKGFARIWRVEHGEYDVALYPEGKEPEKRVTREITKGDSIEVDLPPKAVQVLELRQTKALEPIYDRADLALSHLELKIEGGKVKGKLHNIGLKDVEHAEIALVDPTGKVVARKDLGKLAAPEDFQPKVVDFELEGVPADAKGWAVVADPDNKLAEIFKGNNRLELGKK